MIVFRLSKCIYAGDNSGKGAERSGGRWNSKGVAVLYTSESRALCTTEIAVHTGLGIIPKDYCLVTIEIPDACKILKINSNTLNKNWSVFPHTLSTQILGDAFVNEQKFLVLKVPSAVVAGDFNYIINPYHKDFHKIKIVKTEPFNFDERLFIK